MTRQPPAQEPSLFDVVEPDGAAAPTRARRQGEAPTPPLDTVEARALRRLAEIRIAEWAERIAAARARIEHPEEPPDA